MMISSAVISFLLALAVTLIVLAARLAKEPIRAFFKSYNTSTGPIKKMIAEGLFAVNAVAAQKNCPNCAEPTAISALICDACEYNFLSGTVGSRQKALPAPADITAHPSKPHGVHSRV
jgi:hypothetical protein